MRGTFALVRDQPVVPAEGLNAQGLLTTGTTVRGVFVRGIVPELENTVADFNTHMVAGKLEDLRPGEFGIALGVGLARALHLSLGERVTLVSPPRDYLAQQVMLFVLTLLAAVALCRGRVRIAIAGSAKRSVRLDGTDRGRGVRSKGEFLIALFIAAPCVLAACSIASIASLACTMTSYSASWTH